MPVPKGESGEPTFASYDPTEIHPDLVPGEPPLDLAEEVVEDEILDVAFDEKYVEDFDGLMYLGALTKTFEWVGHKFVIRTLTADEYLMVALLTKPYANSIGEARAYNTAMVAMCVVSVDGQPLPLPIMAEKNDAAWAHQRFNYVKSRWFNFTIDLVNSQFLELEFRANEVLRQMGEASGWGESTSGSDANSESPNVEVSSASPV